MKILTFDTTLNKTYVCLCEDNKIISAKTLETVDDKYHSAFLIQEIANILKTNQLKMSDIDAIGIDIGPGSFTGIRACTTIGRVIAQQMDLPLVASSSMEILSKIFDSQKTAVVLDARKKSAYIAIYENGKEILPPQIIKLEDLPERLKQENCQIITDCAMKDYLQEKEINSINYETENYPLDKYLMEITEEKIKNQNKENLKEVFNWAKVKPLYIQAPSIFGK